MYEDHTIVVEGLQNLGRYSAFRTLEQRCFFVVPYLLRHEIFDYMTLSKGPLCFEASYVRPDGTEDLIEPDSHREVFLKLYLLVICVFKLDSSGFNDVNVIGIPFVIAVLRNKDTLLNVSPRGICII